MSTSDKIQSIIEMLFTWGMEGIDEKDKQPRDIKVSEIARELNTYGVLTKSRGQWSHEQVSRILKREL